MVPSPPQSGARRPPTPPPTRKPRRPFRAAGGGCRAVGPAAAARPLDHIRGEFRYVDLGDGRTEVIWSYSIAPRVFYARPFIRSYLENDFGPFMQSGLQGAATAFNARPTS